MNNYVLLIGGANIDIQGFSYKKFIFKDSNPGSIKISCGGVSRNIAENLARLSLNAKLITALGDDDFGNRILKNGESTHIDFSHSLMLKDKPTSTYLSILNAHGEMITAISDMSILDNITMEFLNKKDAILKNSLLTVLDCNLSYDVLECLTSKYTNIPFFLDTVSSKKAARVKDIIGRFHTIKPNKLECEILSGIKINKRDDAKRASEYFLKKGVKQVFISLAKDGLFYSDGCSEGFIDKIAVKPVNTTGAGDAFVAGLVYSYIKSFSIEYAAKFGLAASLIAIESEDTVNPNISVMQIENKMLEANLC
ncbi:MAG: PfkB family carbohydrate kinase [Oscillospiraceae bacterium]|nr:PfkB family carbohydrate kinase [Oscillospiraceae bacterium]